MAEKKLSWYEKLIAKLSKDPHREKPEYEGLEWKPGEKPLLDINGDGKNFCPYPSDMHFNAADRVQRAKQQRDPNYRPPEDDSDPWAAANDPSLAHYDTPAPPPAIGSPDDPIYIRNQLLDRLRRK